MSIKIKSELYRNSEDYFKEHHELDGLEDVCSVSRYDDAMHNFIINLLF